MPFTLLALGVLIVGLVGVYWWYYRKSHAAESTDRSPPESEDSTPLSPQHQLALLRKNPRLWGYRVESHCRASSRLAGGQFTFDEPAPLPIQGCEARVCECCLIGMADRRHIRDRRDGQDRRRSMRLDENDRRAERPRREADRNSWGSYSHL